MDPFELSAAIAAHSGRLGGRVRYWVEGAWLVLETAADRTPDPLASDDGGPGLWKVVSDAGGPRRAFEVPLAAFPGLDNPEDVGALVSACVDWALATSTGEMPTGWAAPGS